MTDTAKRVFGPGPAYVSSGRTLYTVPRATKFFFRDATFVNLSATSQTVRMSIGDIATRDNRIFDKVIAGNTTYSYPVGLWVIDENEYIQAQQVTSTTPTATSATTGTAGFASSVVSGSWTPAADTLYFLAIEASLSTGATYDVSSITGNGTWTQIFNQTCSGTGDFGRILLYRYYSLNAGASATTTVNWAGTQSGSQLAIFSVSGIYKTGSGLPLYATIPVLQSATAGDSSSPASTNLGLTPDLASALTGGIIVGVQMKTAANTSTPPTGYTEIFDVSTNGSFTGYIITTPPGADPLPANTWSVSNTNVRAAGTIELAIIPDINFMVNGVEVS